MGGGGGNNNQIIWSAVTRAEGAGAPRDIFIWRKGKNKNEEESRRTLGMIRMKGE